MQTTAHRLTSLWTTVRDQLRDSREVHGAHARLERELASYRTDEDLNDLHAATKTRETTEGAGPGAEPPQPALSTAPVWAVSSVPR
jgi:hypothetical protein